MKNVFSTHSEVAHVWAQRFQSQGRAGNIFFEGNRIYSYGYHYEIARFEQNHVLINDRGYSNSTTKHIGIVRGATSHYKQFFVSQVDTKEILERLESAWKSIQRARKPENYWGYGSDPLRYFNEYLSQFDTKAQKNMLASNKDNLKAIKNLIKKLNKFVSDPNIKKRVSANIKAEQERKRKALEKLEKERIEVVRQWKSFEVSNLPWRFDFGSTAFLRFNGDYVETSKGVKVEGEKAYILFTLIEQGRDIKGYKLDHYTVISMNGKLKIGCHEISKEEVYRIGGQLKEKYSK